MSAGAARPGLGLAALALLVALPAGCGGEPLPDTPTFARDVAPILFEHCAVCHRPGEAAPFALLDYADARKRADQIAIVTGSGFMPPWLPEPGYGDFVGERRLDEREIAILARWSETGTPEGDVKDLPPAPVFAAGWLLGEPDLVIGAEAPYRLRADGGDDWRNLILPVPIDATRFVKSIEIRPGNPRVVHHAILRVDATRYSRRLDAKDDLPGFPGMDSGVASNPDGHFYGWTPGRVPLPGDEDTALRLSPGADFVLQLHLYPSGKEEDVRPSVGLHFASRPPSRRQYIVTLDDVTIDIPPGDADHAVEDDFTLPVDVDVLSVYPHAHFLGKTLHGFATLPDGSTRWLVRIDDWDFNWQDEYRFETPVFLPKGSTVRMRYRFDNSAANVRNPHVPPRRVTIGDRTTDEMGQLILQVLPRDAADLARLEEALMLHNAAKRPGDWKAHYNLALVRDKNGRLPEAMAEYERVLALDPKLPFIHEKLGVVLLKLGRTDEGRRRLEEAIRLDPEFAEAHAGLGNALLQGGDAAGALASYETASRLAPNLADADNNIAVALTHLGRFEEAEEKYRAAIRKRPGFALAHENLGLVLLQRKRFADAAGAFEEALRLDPSLAAAKRNLEKARAGMRTE